MEQVVKEWADHLSLTTRRKWFQQLKAMHLLVLLPGKQAVFGPGPVLNRSTGGLTPFKSYRNFHDRHKCPTSLKLNMTRLIQIAVVAFCFPVFITSERAASATQPGWSPNVIASGDQREQLRMTPIEDRPYRPLHFYGNTVRRMHYRGTPLPTVAEAVALPARVVIRR